MFALCCSCNFLSQQTTIGLIGPNTIEERLITLRLSQAQWSLSYTCIYRLNAKVTYTSSFNTPTAQLHDKRPPWFSAPAQQPDGTPTGAKNPSGLVSTMSTTVNDGLRLASEDDPPSTEKDCTEQGRVAQVIAPTQQSRNQPGNQCQPGKIGHTRICVTVHII